MRCDYLMATLNPDDPSLDVYKEYINCSRPLPEWESETPQEIKDEFIDSEGDPQVKGQIRRKLQDRSRRRMMQQLPEADVVITNPTHFAVALKYEPDSGMAPVVIAKGADYLAFQIREKAKECNIEIVENKPLARILYHNVDIGMEIPPELYQAVAEILARVLQPDLT